MPNRINVYFQAIGRGIELKEWDEFISFKPYTLDFNKRFKESIRERDSYCCIICNAKQEEVGYKLMVHHIDYNKNNLDTKNLISLCHKCHAKTTVTHPKKIEYWMKHFIKT